MQRMTISFICLLSTIVLNACFQTPTASQGTVKRLSKDKASGATTEVSTTKAIAAVDSQSKEDVVLAVSGTSNSISGTSISISPGSLNISTSIIIEQGADLRDTSMTEEVSLTNNTAITVAGSGIIVRPSTATILQKPITLNLPLPVNLGLLLAGDYYAVYYKYLDPTSNQLLTGYKVVDGTEVKLVFDEKSRQDVVQFEGYFGAYWIVKLNREVPKEEVPAAKISLEPIANKANTQVIASAGGVVAETQVVVTQAKTEIVWKKPSLQLITGTRKATLAVDMTSVTGLKNCKADIFETVSSITGRNIDSGKETNLTFSLTSLAAQKMVGRFRCQDSEARVTISPWSDTLSVDAYKSVSISSVKATVANGSYTTNAIIPISLTFAAPVTVQGLPTIMLETGAIDRNAVYKSGSGSSTLLFEYVVQQGDETSALNYVSTAALSLGSATITDAAGIAASLKLPELNASTSIAAQNSIVIDSQAPYAPSSIGFSSNPATSTTFPASWTSINDSSFKQYNAKICLSSDCNTSCQSPVSTQTTTASFTASSGIGPFYACVQSEDLAGNLSAFVPSTVSIAVVTSGPVVTSVTSVAPSALLSAGQTVLVDVSFSSAVQVSGSGVELLLDLSTGGRAASYISGSGSASLRFSYVTQAGDNTSDLNYKTTSALSLGSATIKGAGNLNAVLTLPDLLSPNSLAGTSAVVIDTIAPPAAVVLSPANSSYSTSSISSVSGTSEAGANITVKSLGNVIGTGTAVGSNWNVNLTTHLADGVHNLVAFATDAAGNIGPNSSTITVTVRTTAPVAPVFSSLVTPTLNTTPTISGTAEANLVVKVYANSNLVGTTSANGSGAWSMNTSALADGLYTILATATDPGMRVSPVSSSQTISIDTSAPTLPSAISFPNSISNSPSVQVNWTASTDANFKHHNLKLCSSNNCSTSCTSSSISVASPTNLLGVAGSTYYACVQGEDTLGQLSTWAASAGTVQIDTTNATVTNVTATIADGYYTTGTSFDIAVTFSKSIVITNPSSLTLLLETGTTDHTATYSSSSTSTIIFNYTIQAGDTSPDLDYQSVNALALNGATIKDAANNDAVLQLPPIGSGNSLAGQKAIVIDTVAPTNPSSPGFASTYSNTLSLSLAFTPGVDANFRYHNVKLCTDSGCSTSCVGSTTSVGSPATLTGVNGQTYYGCVQSKDYANLMSSWVSTLSPISIDTTAPTVSSVSSSQANGPYKAGVVIPISITFSENVVVIGGGDIKLLLETGTNDRYVLYASGTNTNTLIFNYTVQAGDTSSDLDYISTTALTVGTGSIKDLAGNSAALTLPAPGAANSLGANKAIIVDTTAPVAPNIISPANGSYQMSNVTTVSGSSEANATITVKNGSNAIVTVTASGSSWAGTLGTALTDGSYTLTAYAMDAAGNTSGSSAASSFIVDTTAPTSCTVNVGPSITNNPTPTITGNCEPNMNVSIYADSTLVGSGVTDSSGNFGLTKASSGDGNFAITAKATDPGGRTGPSSNVYNLTIDTTPPVITGVADLSPMHTNTSPTITASVSGGASFAWTKVSGPGSISFSAASSVQTTVTASVEGSYVLRLTAIDSAGNQASQDVTVIWDTTGPVFAGITDVQRSESGTTAWIYWKPANDVYSKPNEVIYQLCWSASICSSGFTSQAVTDGARYEYQVTGLTAGTVYTFGIRAIDKAGNVTNSFQGKTNASASSVTSIAASTLHSCGIFSGVVKCWGANGFGQLGDGSTIDSTQPVTVLGLGGLTPSKVIVGAYFSCALFTNNKVRCWGRNDFGQLGIGSEINQGTAATDALSLSSVTNIEAGSHHVCARTSMSSVYCWGLNESGQVGDGSTTNRSAPVQISGLSSIASVGLGSNHSCAVGSGGETYCWGRNTYGQVGDGTTGNRLSPYTVSSLLTTAQVDAGDDFSCARMNDSTVKCWGRNNFGQLGRGNTTDSTTPTAASGITAATDIVAGAGFACAKDSSTYKCWGNNEWGQFGNATNGGAIIPVSITALSSATGLSLGDNYSCAMFSGVAKCWGNNARGQLGVGSADAKLFPVQIQSVTGIASSGAKTATGLGHSCAIVGSSVQCWGNNSMGQLGNNTLVSSTAPVTAQITGVPTSVVAGDNFSCAVMDDASVQCWGQGTAGQLGNGAGANSSLPVNVGLMAQKLSAAGDSICALTTASKIMCWGKNVDGNLGDGTNVNKTSPVSPSGLSSLNFMDVSNSPSSTCAVASDYSLKCWGLNTTGQLGDLTTTSRSSPVTASIIPSAIAVAAGAVSTCAVLPDQTVKCWGNNAMGQLGNGGFTNSPSVATVATGLSGVTSILGSRGSFCVTSATGVKCWGNNEAGNLGDGTLASQATPSPINTIGAISNISVGPLATCYTHKSNRISCSGKGYYGMFGASTPYYWAPGPKVAN